VRALDADDATQPGREALRVLQPRQVAEGGDERLLDRVLGQVEVAERGVGRAEGHRLVPSHQVGEGVHVAVLRLRDQLGQLHENLPGFDGSRPSVDKCQLAGDRCLGSTRR
jgi:hypothetical protein